MARGRGKFFGLWLLLVAAALYIPFQEFLRSREYGSSDEFFQDLLVWVVIIGIIVTPIISVIAFRRRKRAEKAKAAAKAKTREN